MTSLCLAGRAARGAGDRRGEMSSFRRQAEGLDGVRAPSLQPPWWVRGNRRHTRPADRVSSHADGLCSPGRLSSWPGRLSRSHQPRGRWWPIILLYPAARHELLPQFGEVRDRRGGSVSVIFQEQIRKHNPLTLSDTDALTLWVFGATLTARSLNTSH